MIVYGDRSLQVKKQIVPPDPIQALLKEPLRPRELLLSALFANRGEPISSAQLIRAGRLLGLEENTVRVTLHRLLKDGDAISTKRGSYLLGEQRLPLYRISREWETLPSLTHKWDGDWLTVHIAHLGKSDRSKKRVRERALILHGFFEVVNGLWCRPDNLLIATDLLCGELHALGLDPAAVVATSSIETQDFKQLFSACVDTAFLERGYREGKKRIRKSFDTLHRSRSSTRSRETFKLLNACFKFLASDPLLPSGFIDEHLRNEFHAELVKYYHFGRQAWSDFYLQEGLRE